MTRVVHLFVAVCLLVEVTASLAVADPMQWEANGHWYEALPTVSVTGDEAGQAARGMSWMGMAGHLVTITSQEENAFVAALATAGNYWLGAHQDPPESLSAAGWRWCTGEPWSYLAWHPGEPNDYLGSESCLELYGEFGDWNDVRCSETHYLMVEYDGIAPAEHASWGMIKAAYGLSLK